MGAVERAVMGGTPRYVTFRPGILVFGRSVLAFIHALGRYTNLAENALARQGIRGVQPNGWYPQQAFLNAFREISFELGENTLFAMGKKVPDLNGIPPGIATVEEALAGIDTAYHASHRDADGPLFDPATGALREGIGHYAFRREGPRSGVMVCDTPYPSDFDRGIVAGVARLFRADASVVLDLSKPSRKLGASSCSYVITW
jgi:hypothetical protein